MSDVPWSCVPDWDVPRDYFEPDPPDLDDESFMNMVEERMSMDDALAADGEKLRHLSGEEHGPFYLT